jgi:LPS-assembly lipoprotein
MWFSKIVAVVCCILISGCGFKPLYQNAEQTSQELSGISVPVVAGTFGYELTKELRMLLPQGADTPIYTLKLNPDTNLTGLAIEQDDSVTRYNVQTNVLFELVDGNDEVVIRDTVGTLTSYNAITSQYSTLIAEREALRRSARVLAQKIYQKLYIALKDQ